MADNVEQVEAKPDVPSLRVPVDSEIGKPPAADSIQVQAPKEKIETPPIVNVETNPVVPADVEPAGLNGGEISFEEFQDDSIE